MLAKNYRKLYIIIVKGHKVPKTYKSSSFSPLSYIIQEAVNLVYCFLNFKGLFIFKQQTLLLASFSYAIATEH